RLVVGGHDDVVSVLGEQLGQLESDATGCARHQGELRRACHAQRATRDGRCQTVPNQGYSGPVAATVPVMGGYRELFEASIRDPNAFWADAAKAVTWTREPQQVLDDTNPPFYRWYPDGELNTCANALDRHVDGGRADQPALIYDS